MIDNVWVEGMKNDVITSAEAVKGTMALANPLERHFAAGMLCVVNLKLDRVLKTIGVEVIET